MITKEISEQILDLINKYKKTDIEIGDYIINSCMSNLGHIESYKVLFNEKEGKLLNYDKQEYVSIKGELVGTILFTDFSSVEPYNRTSPNIYIGHDWKRLNLVKTSKTYREFKLNVKNWISNISFPFQVFTFNEFWDMITFSICLKDEDYNNFIQEYRTLINK